MELVKISNQYFDNIAFGKKKGKTTESKQSVNSCAKGDFFNKTAQAMEAPDDYAILNGDLFICEDFERHVDASLKSTPEYKMIANAANMATGLFFDKKIGKKQFGVIMDTIHNCFMLPLRLKIGKQLLNRPENKHVRELYDEFFKTDEGKKAAKAIKEFECYA